MFLQGAAGAAALAFTRRASGADVPDVKAIQAEIAKRHDELVHRLQEWIRQPTIAAGVFATLDAGALKTLGCRPASAGAAVRSWTSTRATKRVWTARRGTSSRR